MRDGTYKLKAAVIERRRLELGLSLNRLADKAEVHVKTLKKWLRGAPAFIENVRMLAVALDVAVNDLKEGEAKAELLEQARTMGINLLLNVPAGQPDPGGHLALFAQFMADAFDEYSNYVQDLEREPSNPGFADFRREQRRQQAKDATQQESTPYIDNMGNAWKQIRVYYVTSFDSKWQEKTYFYFIAGAQLHDQTMESLTNHGRIPAFAVIIARGFGMPSQGVKDMIEAYYGFRHDDYAMKA